MKKSIMIRVPLNFKVELDKLTKKYNYTSRTTLLDVKIVPLMQNADYLSDLTKMFSLWGRKKQ
jgi:hypothetical protein